MSAPIDWNDQLRTHERRLRAIVGARLGEPQAVEEVMQEVSLAAVGQAPGAVDPRKVEAWLCRLADRQSRLYRRRAGRQRKLLGRYADRQPPTSNGASRPQEVMNLASPQLDGLLREERHRLLRQAVDALPTEDARLLRLKYLEGWSYRRLADHFQCTEKAIESRLHRLRIRLRARLADP